MPTTTGIATEFIQFSRTSNATVTDSDGFIKWAPHNFLLASEQFDSASWAKTTTTVAANSIAAPNGTTTADTLTAAGANSTTLQSYTALAVPYTFGVWLRRKTGTGTIEIAADNGTYTAVTITSSWALYTVSQTPVAGTISAGIRIVTSADEVYAWGAHLYRTDLNMQNNTSAYPTYNPTTPKNLLGFTESFDNAAWTKTALAATPVIANTVVAPNGLQTGDTVTENTANDVHSLSQSITAVANTNFCASVYLKYIDCQYVTLSLNRQAISTLWASAVFDLVNGTVSGTNASGGGTLVSSAILPVGNGWFRCNIIGNIGANTDLQFYVATANSATGASFRGAQTFTGTNRAFYLWGAQLSDSASLDPYFPSYSTAPTAAAYYGPRRDFDGSTLACKGLLVEELRTNFLLYSAQFDNLAGWFTADATVTANNVSSPDGTTNADRIVFTTTGGLVVQEYTTTTATTYTASIYLRADSATTVNLRIQQSGGGLATTLCSLTTSWQRFTVSYTAVAPTFIRFLLLPNSNTPTFYAYGAQLEAGSFATSYMPTIANTFQRNVDVANVSIQAFPYNSTEGTLVVSVKKDFLGGDSVSSALYLTSSSNTMELFFNSADSRLYAATGGALQVNLVDSGKVVAGAITKAGFAYATNNYALSTNGGTILPATPATVPPVAALGIGSRNSGLPFRGWIRQVTYLPRRVTNAELQARTA